MCNAEPIEAADTSLEPPLSAQGRPPAAPKKSIHARWQEDSSPPLQTFKDYWDALPPLRPVPGRTRSLQLPVYQRGAHLAHAQARVSPTTP